MKKIMLLYFITVIFVIPIYSQSGEILYGSSIDGFVRFSENTIDLDILDYQHNGSYDYHIETRSNIRFLKYGDITNIICASSKLIYLLNSRHVIFEGVGYNGAGRSGRHISFIGGAERYTSSSFLTEGNIKYEASNLSSLWTNRPWVEGVAGDGIGEYVELENSYGMDGLIIINGFISFDRPELYLYNNRVKTIRVSVDDGVEFSEHKLEDSTSPQIIQLSKSVKKVKIEIADVYKGSRWDDTCIAMIHIISGGMSDIFIAP